MSTQAETAGGRISLSPATLGLFAGDVVAIGLFVVLGEISHGIDPMANAPLVADTFAPFLIGWLLLAGTAGLYGVAVETGPKRTAALTFGTWVGAVVIAQALRATAYFHGNAALAFALVSVAIGGLFLVGWRTGVAVFRQRSDAP